MNDENRRRKVISKLKNIRTISVVSSISLGLLPLAFTFVLCIIALAQSNVNIFSSLTLSGGEVYYNGTYEDLPKNLTTNGIETWSEEQKAFFNNSKKEMEYYNNNFIYYNANEIKDDSEKYDLTIPIATAHYQGTVNLRAYDKTFEDDEDNSSEYNGELIVRDNKTKDFFEEAGKRVGNTFMAYPGLRLLMGNLVKNYISFDTVEYREWECDGKICNNASEIYSDWSYLGKISSSNETEARNSYSPEKAVEQLSKALTNGQNICDSENIEDTWLKKNSCYETDLFYNEVFGKKIDGSSKNFIIEYLRDQYDAEFKYDSIPFSVGTEYITVEVKKSLDQETYEKYLREVYIPYLYLDCEDCGYADANIEVRNLKIEEIYYDLRSFINSFKNINEETIFFDKDFSVMLIPGHFGSYTPTSGFAYLPDEFYDQLISPLESSYGTTLTSCVGYYDAIENTSYYCTGHDAADIAGSGGIIVAPADGVVTSCYTDYGSWGPLLGITHTLKDKDGNDVEVISWYRHWVDMNGNIDCSTFDDRVVKQGEAIAKESNQAGKYSVGTHLHFKLVSPDGEVYYIEDFLTSKGVNTNSAFGTTDCDSVRRICDEYCEDNECTSTYAKN